MKDILYNDFYNIVMNEIPLIDVRAPIEFEKGTFRHSVNLPIMNNEERALVGTMYKQEGNSAATELGYELVSGEVREARTKAWGDFLEQYPNALLHCFRGGQRSQIAQQWVWEVFHNEIPRLEGGYKAFRQYLMEALKPENIRMKPIILGGYTGGGKTILLHKLRNHIDLEGLANHRGSSFGRHATPQPTQINFENDLAYALIQTDAKGFQHMILEDEGSHVGQCYLPKPLCEYFNTGQLVILEETLENRVNITLQEYVVEAQQEHIEAEQDYEMGMEAWLAYITASMTRLKRRLGGARLQELLLSVEEAYKTQQTTGDVSGHAKWIEIFLKDYYDPMYQYQIDNNTKDIIYRGNTTEVFDFLSHIDNVVIK